MINFYFSIDKLVSITTHFTLNKNKGTHVFKFNVNDYDEDLKKKEIVDTLNSHFYFRSKLREPKFRETLQHHRRIDHDFSTHKTFNESNWLAEIKKILNL